MSAGRVILVQRRLPREKSYLHELRELAQVAGYEPVLEVEQIRPPDPAYQIGRGKVKELAKLVKELDVDKVIFFNELKPVQALNLAKELGVDVIDRFQLILEIFVRRAGTKEAKLQIELAQLKRQLSFVREYIRAAKSTEFPGFMGGGEYEISVFEKHVKQRIARIERELKRIRRRKAQVYRRRSETGVYTISLTGYTGAGKTTLFNTLTGERKYIDGKPFATLSTFSRRIRVRGLPAVLTDTIGFIDCLPPLLLEAFYTTLAELENADLILLLVDGSEELSEIERKIRASTDILRSLGVLYKPVVVVLNKIDLLDEDEVRAKVEYLSELKYPVVPISAKLKINLDVLEAVILSKLPGLTDAVLLVNKGSLESVMPLLIENTRINWIISQAEVVRIHVTARRSWLLALGGRLKSMGIGEVQVLEEARRGVEVRAQTSAR